MPFKVKIFGLTHDKTELKAEAVVPRHQLYASLWHLVCNQIEALLPFNLDNIVEKSYFDLQINLQYIPDIGQIGPLFDGKTKTIAPKTKRNRKPKGVDNGQTKPE